MMTLSIFHFAVVALGFGGGVVDQKNTHLEQYGLDEKTGKNSLQTSFEIKNTMFLHSFPL